MSLTTWELLLVGIASASALMVVMWLIQVRSHHASHVDVAWTHLLRNRVLGHPEDGRYQQQVSVFVPLPPRHHSAP